MEKLEESLIEIFEVDSLDLSAKISDLDEWDSLSSLSVIAMLDSDYQITMTNAELLNFKNLGEFCNYVIANKR